MILTRNSTSWLKGRMVWEDLHDVLGSTTFGGFDELCSAQGGNHKKRCAWAEWRGESPKWIRARSLVGFEGWVCFLKVTGAIQVVASSSLPYTFL